MKSATWLFAATLAASTTAWADEPVGIDAGAAARSETELETQAATVGAEQTVETASRASADLPALAIESGAELRAKLEGSVSTKAAKVGDEVRARLTRSVESGGEVVLERGATLVGHVTKVKSIASAGASSRSELGIRFDRAVTGAGAEFAIDATVQALAMVDAEQTRLPQAPRPTPRPARGGGGGGLLGDVVDATGVDSVVGASSSLGVDADVLVRSSGATGGLDVGGDLRSGSRGVFGLRGLDIESTSDLEGSLFVASGRDVKLESRTQLLLTAGARAD